MVTGKDAVGSSMLTRFNQVGFVVGDAEHTARNYAEKFGIGPWRIKRLKHEGKVVSVVARCWVGHTDFELIESDIPETIHAQFQRERGDTLHHICFYPDTPEKYEGLYQKMKEYGYALLDEGNFPGGIKYGYFDTTRDLGSIIEIAYFPGGITDSGESELYIEPGREAFLGEFGQVGYVVHDSESVAANYYEKFNVGPWRVKVLQEPGKEPSVVCRAWFGDIDIELIEPHAPEPQMHSSFLAKYGNTLHHLCFYSKTMEKYEKAYETLAAMGYGMLEKGGWSGGVQYAYFDCTADIGIIVEIAYFPGDITDPNPPAKIIGK